MNRKEVLTSKNLRHITTRKILEKMNKEKSKKFPLLTNNENLDALMGGGFNFGRKYLLFGANRTGKTQLCHQIVVQAVKQFGDKSSSSQKTIIYIDTENTFRPERIREMCQTQRIDSNTVLKNILISKVVSNSALLMALKNVEKNREMSNFKFLLIDSINNHYRVEQGEKNKSFSKIKSTFLECLKIVHYLTMKYNLITVVTSQISPNFSESPAIKEMPVGNIYLNHFFSEYIYLSHEKEDKYKAHLVNSNFLPEKRITYKITSEGI